MSMLREDRTQYRLKGAAHEAVAVYEKALQEYIDTCILFEAEIKKKFKLPKEAQLAGNRNASEAMSLIGFVNVNGDKGHPRFCKPRKHEGSIRRIKKSNKEGQILARKLERLSASRPKVFSKDHLGAFGFHSGYFKPPYLVYPMLWVHEDVYYVYNVPKEITGRNEYPPEHEDVEEVPLSEWAAIVEKRDAA
jgi:hypothetical protein